MDIINAIILGIIEGLTEFLPVSSTGHLVLSEWFLRLNSEAPPWNVLIWVSQFGAILAVIVYFWRDLWHRTFNPLTAAWQKTRAAPSLAMRTRRALASVAWRDHILVKLLAAMVPTVLAGVWLKKHFDKLEGMPVAVAGALIIGAGIMEFIDRRYRREIPQTLENVTLRQAFLIGAIQCISIWPGVSRAGASIMGGMVLGLSPRVATEFSFYLAIPTMLGAAVLTLWKHRHDLDPTTFSIVVVGSAVAFVVALLVVMGFISYVKRYRFTLFAIYRVVLGVAVLIGYFATRT